VVAAAIKLIDDAPTEAWTLNTLAAQVHVEPTYLARLFHAVVGLPPMAYVTRRRLELATKLLRPDYLAVGEVGAMAGWPDKNDFSRCFRQHFGMTPSRYRTRFSKGFEPRMLGGRFHRGLRERSTGKSPPPPPSPASPHISPARLDNRAEICPTLRERACRLAGRRPGSGIQPIPGCGSRGC
jgi:AraC-like DNA-binding protein